MEQKSITRDGVKLSYIVHKSKNKPWLLLIHGWGSNHSIWDPYVQYFKSKYNIITPDLRGHGLSDDAHDLSYAAMADDLIAMLTKEKATPVQVMGHSLGALIALELQERASKKVKNLVIITPLAGKYIFARPLVTVAIKGMGRLIPWPKQRAFMRYWKENGKPIEFSIPLDAKGTTKRTLIKTYEAARAYRIRWDRITCPTLVLQGAHDVLVSHRRLRLATKDLPLIRLVFVHGKHTIATHNTANMIEKLEVFWG